LSPFVANAGDGARDRDLEPVQNPGHTERKHQAGTDGVNFNPPFGTGFSGGTTQPLILTAMMIAVLLAFIGYQLYRIILSPTVGLIALTALTPSSCC
jgi:hypothetical protein